MSVIYKCDRCNRRLKSLNPWYHIKFFDKHENYYDWDLCPKCAKGLYAFLGIEPGAKSEIEEEQTDND